MNLILQQWEGPILFLKSTKWTSSIKTTIPTGSSCAAISKKKKKEAVDYFSASVHRGCQCQSDCDSTICYLKKFEGCTRTKMEKSSNHTSCSLAHWFRRTKESGSWEGGGEKVTTSRPGAERPLNSIRSNEIYGFPKRLYDIFRYLQFALVWVEPGTKDEMKGRFCLEDFHSVMRGSKWNQPVQTVDCDNKGARLFVHTQRSDINKCGERLLLCPQMSRGRRADNHSDQVTRDSAGQSIPFQSIPSRALNTRKYTSALHKYDNKFCKFCCCWPYWPAFLMCSGIVSNCEPRIITSGPKAPGNKASKELVHNETLPKSEPQRLGKIVGLSEDHFHLRRNAQQYM